MKSVKSHEICTFFFGIPPHKTHTTPRPSSSHIRSIAPAAERPHRSSRWSPAWPRRPPCKPTSPRFAQPSEVVEQRHRVMLVVRCGGEFNSEVRWFGGASSSSPGSVVLKPHCDHFCIEAGMVATCKKKKHSVSKTLLPQSHENQSGVTFVQILCDELPQHSFASGIIEHRSAGCGTHQ